MDVSFRYGLFPKGRFEIQINLPAHWGTKVADTDLVWRFLTARTEVMGTARSWRAAGIATGMTREQAIAVVRRGYRHDAPAPAASVRQRRGEASTTPSAPKSNGVWVWPECRGRRLASELYKMASEAAGAPPGGSMCGGRWGPKSAASAWFSTELSAVTWG